MKTPVRYGYVTDWDILSLAPLSGEKGKYEGSYSITGDKQGHLGLIVDVDDQGKCIAIEFFDAAELLLPYLLPGKFQETGLAVNLAVEYDQETDTLFFHNDMPANHSEAVTDGWIAHYNTEGEYAEEEGTGEVVGFTLECASETLLPHLLKYSYAPVNSYKRERMKAFRRSEKAVG